MNALVWPLVLLPFADLLLLVWIGRRSSWLFVLLLVVVGFLLGTALLRHVVGRSLGSVRADLAAGRAPDASLRNSLAASAAAVLLIFPGVLTDVLALSLVVPFTRGLLAALLARQFKGRIDVRGFAGTVDRDEESAQHDRVIDVRVVDPSQRTRPHGEGMLSPPGDED